MCLYCVLVDFEPASLGRLASLDHRPFVFGVGPIGARTMEVSISCIESLKRITVLAQFLKMIGKAEKTVGMYDYTLVRILSQNPKVVASLFRIFSLRILLANCILLRPRRE